MKRSLLVNFVLVVCTINAAIFCACCYAVCVAYKVIEAIVYYAFLVTMFLVGVIAVLVFRCLYFLIHPFDN